MLFSMYVFLLVLLAAGGEFYGSHGIVLWFIVGRAGLRLPPPQSAGDGGAGPQPLRRAAQAVRDARPGEALLDGPPVAAIACRSSASPSTSASAPASAGGSPGGTLRPPPSGTRCWSPPRPSRRPGARRPRLERAHPERLAVGRRGSRRRTTASAPGRAAGQRVAGSSTPAVPAIREPGAVPSRSRGRRRPPGGARPETVQRGTRTHPEARGFPCVRRGWRGTGRSARRRGGGGGARRARRCRAAARARPPGAARSTLPAASGVESSSIVARRCCALATPFTRSVSGPTCASAPGPDGAQSE